MRPAHSGLQDAEGRLIDGNHDGQPGGNAMAQLSRGGATVSALVNNPARVKTIFSPSAVDDLLEGGHLVRLKRSGYSKHPTIRLMK